MEIESTIEIGEQELKEIISAYFKSRGIESTEININVEIGYFGIYETEIPKFKSVKVKYKGKI